jgi:hypothetical protein
VTLIAVGNWMMTHHPFQNLYFNVLTPKGSSESFESASQLFELDYWGTSNVRVLRYLLQSRTSETIRICSLGITSVAQSLAMLDENEKVRIQIVTDPEEAEFCITNFRFITPQQRDFLKDSSWSTIYSVVVDQRIVSSVLQKK